MFRINIKYTVLILIFESLLDFGMCSHVAFQSPDLFFHELHREKRYVTYPAGTAIGLLVAIALPVEVPEENLYFSLNFEANYNLPDNITQYYNSDIARVLHSITRRSTYNLLQNQLTRYDFTLNRRGYYGEECLLRLICEVSTYEIEPSGLLETILQIIFRPSHSQQENLPEIFIQAEKFGSTGNCSSIYSNCDMSLLDLISVLQ